MNWNTVPKAGLRALLGSLGLCLVLALRPAVASPTELADIPLVNSTTTTIMPNIMLDLDNSGSMNFAYMPDMVRSAAMCRGPASSLVTCENGDPPFYASGFNSIYYNPAIRYVWPVNYDGKRRPDQTSNKNTSYSSPWGAVASDGYGIQSIDDSSAQPLSAKACSSSNTCPSLGSDDTVDLVAKYPERVWCKNSTDTPPSVNCKSALDSSNAYSFPNSTYPYAKQQLGPAFYYNVKVEWCTDKDGSPNQMFGKPGTCAPKQGKVWDPKTSKTLNYQYPRYYDWSRVDITPSTKFPAKGVDRSDCVGATCTYNEEMTNFATWFAWYRTRAQMTKSAIGLSFSDVRGAPVAKDPKDANFLHARVGMTTINNPLIFNIDDFSKLDTAGHTQKYNFYTHLYEFSPGGGTPLRGSLKAVGEMYAGNKDSDFSDPVQYSCQKNFAILATDGYWNSQYTTDQDFSFADEDGADGVTLPSRDGNKAGSTLADVAYHYYHTDLRTTNCGTPDICENNVAPSGVDANVDDVASHQHMTTFTIGLGVDGTLDYDPNYKTSKAGSYFDIKQGAKLWPVPYANLPETIDDLWHAAVNGRGTYFSAKNPTSLESSLRKTLSSIDSASGSGAAAATSNLQPTTGDNFIYVATYRTLMWDGEVSAYSIDLQSGAISNSAIWQAEPLLHAKIAESGDSDKRVIYTGYYTNTGNIVRTSFIKADKGGLSPDQLALFDPSKLSQATGWTTAQSQAATPESLVNYLRGQDRNEDQDRSEKYGGYQRLYRDRDKVLGDIVHAQPIYVKVPPFEFGDSGYATFKSDKSNRTPVLYVAANDGMLHAFDGATGNELWAYVPPMLLPNLPRLADTNYTNKHNFYIDGPMTISDAFVGGQWKTILIGALGKGGRGYYAVDVTDPADPKPMWDFTADRNNNVGYSYGTPYITKRADGAWVAVVTSGYNNIPEDNNKKYPGANGGGYVFVLDLADGHVLNTISTVGSAGVNVGTVANPSGLARLNIRVKNFGVDNTAVAAYGGDLTGAMWRFDLDKGTASKLADFGPDQPIMSAPEIGEIQDPNDVLNYFKMVYFGTGRYLGKGDLDDTAKQRIYGIRDYGDNTVTSTSNLVQQSVSTSGSTRSISGGTGDVSAGKPGWFVELPDSGERVTLDPQLYFGTLVVASTVPSITDCQPGGYGWLYQLDYKSGANVIKDKPGAMKFSSPIVGESVSELPNGKPIIHVVTADGSKPNAIQMQVAPDPNAQPRRVLWRELSN